MFKRENKDKNIIMKKNVILLKSLRLNFLNLWPFSQVKLTERD